MNIYSKSKIPVVTEIHLYAIDQREICASIFLSFFLLLFLTAKFVVLLNVNIQQSLIRKLFTTPEGNKKPAR